MSPATVRMAAPSCICSIQVAVRLVGARERVDLFTGIALSSPDPPSPCPIARSVSSASASRARKSSIVAESTSSVMMQRVLAG